MEKERILFCEKELSLNLHALSMQPDIPYRGDHLHNEAELIRAESGNMVCYIDGTAISLAVGDLLLVNARVIHRLSAATTSNCRYMQIDIDRYRREASDEKSADLSPLFYALTPEGAVPSYILFRKYSTAHEIFDGIWREVSEKSAAYHIAVRGYVFRLLALMYREKLLFDPSLSHSHAGYERILPALQYVETHYQAKITLDDIAIRLQCDKYHFCKQFKKITGMTFVDYLNNRRLRAAEELLLTTDQSIADIAFVCGFNSIQYFNKFFRSRRRISPGAYRSKSI